MHAPQMRVGLVHVHVQFDGSAGHCVQAAGVGLGVLVFSTHGPPHMVARSRSLTGVADMVCALLYSVRLHLCGSGAV